MKVSDNSRQTADVMKDRYACGGVLIGYPCFLSAKTLYKEVQL